MKNLIYLIISLFTISSFSSCESSKSINKSQGSPISDFNIQDILIKGKGEIYLTVSQGEKDYMEIDATEEQLELLTINNSKNKLFIDGDKELENFSRTINIDIEVKDLNSIKIKKGDNDGIKPSDNKVTIRFLNEMVGDSLVIYAQGKNEIVGLLNYEYIKLHHEGILNSELEGSAKYLDLHVEGIAKIDAYNLIAEDGNVHSEGISRINVNLQNDANVKAEGIHLIKYNDNPNIKFKREGIVLRQRD
jgi:biopolymer transport protein ExbD